MTADDWVKIIGAVATATALVLSAVGGVYVQVARTHKLVNSRMDELLALTAKSSLAEGRLGAPISENSENSALGQP